MKTKPKRQAGGLVKNQKNAGRGNGASGHQYGYGRFAAERVMGMHRQVEDGQYPSATRLAREFSISVRTIKRDIWYLKVMLNLPLAFDVPRNGFYFTKPVPHLPAIPLTEKEVVGLFLAQKGIAQYQGTALQPVLESAFRKMTALSSPWAIWMKCFQFGRSHQETRSWKSSSC